MWQPCIGRVQYSEEEEISNSTRYKQLNLGQENAAVCANVTQVKGIETWIPGR